MSLPWGTATSLYLIFSPVFLRLARLLPPCTVGRGSLSPVLGSPAPLAWGARSKSFVGAEPHTSRAQAAWMHLSYEAPPAPNLAESREKTPLNIQLSHLPSIPPWSGELTCTGTPLGGSGLLSQLGHCSECGVGDAGLAQWDKLGCRPLGRGIFGAISLLSGPGWELACLGQRQQRFCSPWALLWAQPRLLYNLGFPGKLKREMKGSCQSSCSVPPEPWGWSVIPTPAFPEHSTESKPARVGLEGATLGPRARSPSPGSGMGEPRGADLGSGWQQQLPGGSRLSSQ